MSERLAEDDLVYLLKVLEVAKKELSPFEGNTYSDPLKQARDAVISAANHLMNELGRMHYADQTGRPHE